jgi:hypothetical protein
MTLDRFLRTIIGMQNIDNFTVLEIRTAYIALMKAEHVDPSKVRTVVYTQLNKLADKGLLRKSTSERRVTTFIKTKAFYATFDQNMNEQDLKAQFIAECKAQLNTNNGEHLSILGSLQSYRELLLKRPHLRFELEKSYLLLQKKESFVSSRIAALNEVVKLYNQAISQKNRYFETEI